MLLYDNSACKLMSIFIGAVQVCFMKAPVGDCDNCCQRDDNEDIKYKLYTRNRPYLSRHEIIRVNDFASLNRTQFSFSQPTVIYLFGFSESATGASTVALKNAFLSNGDYNFISVDWSRLIVFPWYISALRNTRYMGKRLADFIQFLDTAGVPAGSVYVIGFSLGAEAAGFAGKELQRRGLKLGRITGLDPAYPGYSVADSSGHLAKGDAIFVDVIHTNPGVFGFPKPIGDVDFYPNPGAWIQPGCWFDQLIKNRQLSFIYGCSHNRAWRLYAESLQNPSGFPATLCMDWRNVSSQCGFTMDGFMGFGAQPPTQGKLYLTTNDKPPFARNGP
ncbi:phospholipase A1 [Leptidea sinapis]|uniref:phospholipase A1 n=1 Tax=Leptidea sinapis TaxID=189913 RepID=UPI00213322E6|nr:phospholipase A1 [Leptidea sinapis]